MSTNPVVTQPTAEEIAALKARIAELEAKDSTTKAGKLAFKVSEKGAVSVYGMGRFPVTLYGSQWETLAEHMPQILAFVQDNRSRLATKPSPAEKPFALDGALKKRAEAQINTLRSVAKTRELNAKEQDTLAQLEVLLA